MTYAQQIAHWIAEACDEPNTISVERILNKVATLSLAEGKRQQHEKDVEAVQNAHNVHVEEMNQYVLVEKGKNPMMLSAIASEVAASEDCLKALEEIGSFEQTQK